MGQESITMPTIMSFLFTCLPAFFVLLGKCVYLPAKMAKPNTDTGMRMLSVTMANIEDP